MRTTTSGKGKMEERISQARVAIAHDYLTQRGGAEKVVLAMSRAFPEAAIHTLLFDPSGTYPEFGDRDIRVSPLNRIAPLRRNHRAALPFLPFAARSMHIDADVVLTSSSGWAHGFTTTGAKLVYCYSPARWLYMSKQYLGEHSSPVKSVALQTLSSPLRSWDRRAALSCERYLAISTVTRERIADVYDIDAEVLPAPVGMTGDEIAEPVAELTGALEGDYYLCVSRLLPYKNVDKVVRAFADSARTLVVVGRGPEAERIRSMKTPNVVMLSDLTDAQMVWIYQHCRAVIAASYEDYGLTPIEAGVWGRPSVVLRWGGFLDTVVEDVTGVFFDEPEPAAIRRAVDRLEGMSVDPDKIRASMQRFSETAFADALRTEVNTLMEGS